MSFLLSRLLVASCDTIDEVLHRGSLAGGWFTNPAGANTRAAECVVEESTTFLSCSTAKLTTTQCRLACTLLCRSREGDSGGYHVPSSGVCRAVEPHADALVSKEKNLDRGYDIFTGPCFERIVGDIQVRRVEE